MALSWRRWLGMDAAVLVPAREGIRRVWCGHVSAANRTSPDGGRVGNRSSPII